MYNANDHVCNATREERQRNGWRVVCHRCGFKYPVNGAGARCCDAPDHRIHCLTHPCERCSE